MEENVDKVISQRIQTMQQIVDLEGEDTEWSVGLVRLLLLHGDAPEVIEEEVGERSAGEDVSVVSDGAGVIKHEATDERVEVAEDSDNTEDQDWRVNN